MSRINGDQRFPRVPSRVDKVRVPVWMLLVAVAGKLLWLARGAAGVTASPWRSWSACFWW
ncbi:hypothetical protein ThrDRAFT_02305 [Frankia casuarinae]|jgi:hypothetical protein|nr:hypothetical protein ThrDRAFT_02305 [Frankia casuarinae]